MRIGPDIVGYLSLNRSHIFLYHNLLFPAEDLIVFELFTAQDLIVFALFLNMIFSTTFVLAITKKYNYLTNLVIFSQMIAKCHNSRLFFSNRNFRIRFTADF